MYLDNIVLKPESGSADALYGAPLVEQMDESNQQVLKTPEKSSAVMITKYENFLQRYKVFLPLRREDSIEIASE